VGTVALTESLIVHLPVVGTVVLIRKFDSASSSGVHDGADPNV
jgi:hypothetical protein